MDEVVSIAPLAGEPGLMAYECPKCGYDLITGDWHGIQIDQCTHCHGLWLDADEAEALVKHPEPTMFGRVFRAVMRGVTGARASDA